MVDVMPKLEVPGREYLGDGVYARFDGYQVWLEVSDGVSFFNPIALEPGVFRNLIEFGKRFM